MTPRRTDAAERILREAMRLFAERGYERTSIPDIQAAAGLTPGSGAMYKHYPSKESVLRIGMARFVRQSREVRGGLHDTSTPAFPALAVMVRQALAVLASERDELRVAWRELDPFPDVQAEVRSDVMQASYRELAAWLEAKARQGELRPHDSEAMAAVLLGSVAMFRVYEALWGEKLVPIDDERFARAWHELVTSGLAPGGEGTPAATDAMESGDSATESGASGKKRTTSRKRSTRQPGR